MIGLIENIQFYSEAYRQIAFVSAVLGGFSVAFLGVILVAKDQRRLTGWTIALSIAASVMFILVTFLNSFLAFTLPGFNAKLLTDLPPQVLSVAEFGVLAFYGGVFALLASLALGGWMRSKAVGWFATVLTSVAAIAILQTAYVLGKNLNG